MRWPLFVTIVSASACGGRAEVGPADSPRDGGADVTGDVTGDVALDAPTADAPSVPDTSPPEASIPDVAEAAVPDTSIPDAPYELCSGPPKIEMAHGTPVEVPVSTGLIAMDCCESFAIRFHAASAVGFDVEFAFQSFGDIPIGTLSLDPSGSQYTAHAQPILDEPIAWAPVSGDLQIEQIGAGEAYRVRLCGQVQRPGEMLDGTGLYSDWITLAYWGWGGRFQIRLLADQSIPATVAMEFPLESLGLGPAVLSLDQLGAYAWSDHALLLQGPWSSAAGILAQLPTVPVHGLPFVVTVDEQRIYLGAFTTDISSLLVPLPSISVDDPDQHRIVIRAAPTAGADPRQDPRVSALMEEVGKLVP